uniref:Sod_Cu domain-containing protein n=1 Tax=Steinernema glaseri TaxID=37863 RepID=A0A1I8AV34_9BILA
MFCSTRQVLAACWKRCCAALGVRKRPKKVVKLGPGPSLTGSAQEEEEEEDVKTGDGDRDLWCVLWVIHVGTEASALHFSDAPPRVVVPPVTPKCPPAPVTQQPSAVDKKVPVCKMPTSNSRFKIVPVESHYKRGRWHCHDFYDEGGKKAEGNPPKAAKLAPTNKSKEIVAFLKVSGRRNGIIIHRSCGRGWFGQVSF